MGGNQPRFSQRPGRLLGEEEERGQVQHGEEGHRRCRRARPKETAKTEAKSQGGRTKLPARELVPGRVSAAVDHCGDGLQEPLTSPCSDPFVCERSLLFEFIASVAATNLQLPNLFAIHLDDPRSQCRFYILDEI